MAFGSYSAYKFLFEGENPIGPALVVGAILLGIGIAIVQRVGTQTKNRQRQNAPNPAKARVDQLRSEGKLKGPFTFADAVELTTTGTIAPKSLAQKIYDSAPRLHWLYDSIDHGALYQFEMAQVSLREIDAALEASRALGLSSVERTLQETKAAFEEFDHVRASARAQNTTAPADWYDELYQRTYAIAARHLADGGSYLYTAAAKRYLSKHAPHLLPLPSP